MRCLRIGKDDVFNDWKTDMKRAAAVKDSEQAARYAATVRPAVALARYVRADKRNGMRQNEEGNMRDVGDGAGRQGGARRSGEGAILRSSDVLIGDSGEARDGNSVEHDGDVVSSAGEGASVNVVNNDDDASLTSTGCEKDKDHEYDVEQARAVRQLAKHQKKRERVKRTSAVRQAVAREDRRQEAVVLESPHEL
ncbi:hypothetical protein PPTG_16406 [Phytophthora nicotianae INRA-310]|uniref:Uncharacterized protein n=1 Tax=Phytophthora nicotianae (strain INRA-310) TaxID=761204 RepID=W2PR30_PHYN3|nr:hypothetical protein PPTG_16406 [Phytophthora nicotianae INRA-310]ETN02450.1 hypothetical protein PPTG_16406 [Phytophthora nicotianae INRA-310]